MAPWLERGRSPKEYRSPDNTFVIGHSEHDGRCVPCIEVIAATKVSDLTAQVRLARHLMRGFREAGIPTTIRATFLEAEGM